MIRLGLRLTLYGGRDAAVRLAVTAVAVAIGVGLLLSLLAGINAVNAQNARYAWLGTGTDAAAAAAGTSDADPLWWRLSADHIGGEVVGRVDVAATGPDSPVPPGLGRLPDAGEFFASPALSDALREMPDALDGRYPGRQVGTIGDAALPGPEALLVVVGHAPGELESVDGATRVAAIGTTSPSSCSGDCVPVGIDGDGIKLILSVVAAALLFPVLIFIGVATRLSAARREQRFAAMRLVGATPRQISVISAVESGVAALLGTLGGFVVFAALRPALAQMTFTDTRFFVADLTLTVVDVVAVGLGVPLAAVVVARLSLRRVQISPLGVTRRVTPARPRAYRLVPLVLGLGSLTWFVVVGSPDTSNGDVVAYLSGLLLTMVGLVVAGPWLTMVGSRLMARRTGRPSVLIAARRLDDDPRVAFRAISGLVLALFVTTAAVSTITTFTAERGEATSGAAAAATLVKDFQTYTDDGPQWAGSVGADVLDDVRAVPGVRAVALVHIDPRRETEASWAPGLVTCEQLATSPALGDCPPGAATAEISRILGTGAEYDTSAVGHVWPAGPTTASDLARLPVRALAVTTDGSTSAIEAARTVLELAYPSTGVPRTIGESNAEDNELISQYQRLAEVVILVSLPIAGASLAVSVIAGMNDRRRPFSLLRLTGVPVSLLRRVVILESVVPLALGAAVAVGTGLLASALFLRSQLDYGLVLPDAGFAVIVAAGLVLAVAVVASTLPVLARVTGPEVARND